MLNPKIVVATIPVTDLERSKQFYGGTLGLRLLHENPFSVRYDAGGGSQLSLFKRPPTKTEHTQRITLWVDSRPTPNTKPSANASTMDTAAADRDQQQDEEDQDDEPRERSRVRQDEPGHRQQRDDHGQAAGGPGQQRRGDGPGQRDRHRQGEQRRQGRDGHPRSSRTWSESSVR